MAKTPKKAGKPEKASKPVEEEIAELVSAPLYAELTDELKKKLEKKNWTALTSQVKTEWNAGWWHLKPKFDEWALRLRLYNNQKRDKEAVGDTTLFTVFNTVLADLYEDRLMVTFGPREMGDDETAENLNLAAEYDYDLMQKDELDYDWDWETGFFGRGLCAMFEFDRERMHPVPEMWYAMTVIRDPNARSVNGDARGRGKARFIYREVRMSKKDMEDMGVYFNIDGLKEDATSTTSPLDEYMRATAEAAGLSNGHKDEVKGENATIRLREGFTRHNGKLVFVTLDGDMNTVVRYHELDTKLIPIIDRVLFPIPNSWDSVSIPDLVEDKQRARAVALNLSLKSVRASLNPMYFYDKTKFDDHTDFNFAFNKFIGVRGNPTGAVVPMQKDTIDRDVQFVMDTLREGAERALATPDVKQGARPQNEGTATRDSLVSQGADKRYSLAARIFGWSERRFWAQWYQLLKTHMEDGIDEKMVRIAGSLGPTWRPFAKDQLVTPNLDPDVKIESLVVSEAKRVNEANLLRDYLRMAVADPEANIRFGLRHYGKLIGLKHDILSQIFPETAEELHAADENANLLKGQREEVEATDDHRIHLHVHNKLPDSPYKTAHMNAHKRALLLERLRPDLVPRLDQPNGAAVGDQNLPTPARESAMRPMPERARA